MSRFARKLEEALATLGGIDVGAPPTGIDDSDEGGDEWRWNPQSKDISLLYKWVKENFKAIARPIHAALEQADPHADVYPIHARGAGMGSSYVYGSAVLHVDWIVQDIDRVMIALKPLILRTDLLARLKVPYERGYDLMEDDLFLNYFIRAVQQVLNIDKHAPFWLFERQQELLSVVREHIQQYLTKSGAQHDRLAPGTGGMADNKYEVSDLELSSYGQPKLGLAYDYDIPYLTPYQAGDTYGTQLGPQFQSAPLALKVAAALEYTYKANVVVPGHTQPKMVTSILHGVRDLLDWAWEEISEVLEVEPNYNPRSRELDPTCEPSRHTVVIDQSAHAPGEPDALTTFIQGILEFYEVPPEQIIQTLNSISPKVWKLVSKQYETNTYIQVGRDDYQDIELPVTLQVLDAKWDNNRLSLLVGIDVGTQ